MQEIYHPILSREISNGGLHLHQNTSKEKM